MITIDKINWLSEETKEAEVFLSDGKFSIIVFSHPLNYIVGDNIPMPLYTLNAREIYNPYDSQKESIENMGEAFEVKLTGYVIDIENNEVKIGEFVIQLDNPLPFDTKIGDYISFECDRVDI